jgi:hypothetical protein
MPSSSNAHIFCKYNFVLISGLVARAQQVANREQKQEEFDCTPNGVVLVTTPNVTQQNRGTRHFLELL